MSSSLSAESAALGVLLFSLMYLPFILNKIVSKLALRVVSVGTGCVLRTIVSNRKWYIPYKLKLANLACFDSPIVLSYGYVLFGQCISLSFLNFHDSKTNMSNSIPTIELFTFCFASGRQLL